MTRRPLRAPSRLACAPIAVALTALAACGGDDAGDDTPVGTPPTIEGLTFDPAQVPPAQQSVITGRFTFHDADSDADRFAAAITTPDGTRQEVAPSKAPGTSGQTSGQVGFLVAVAPPVAGTYTLELWMIDEAGNESNHLAGPLEASPAK